MTLLAGALKDVYDASFLVSADGDFAPVVREVRESGKRVYVAFFGDARSFHLDRAADGFVDLRRLNLHALRWRRPSG